MNQAVRLAKIDIMLDRRRFLALAGLTTASVGIAGLPSAAAASTTTSRSGSLTVGDRSLRSMRRPRRRPFRGCDGGIHYRLGIEEGVEQGHLVGDAVNGLQFRA